MIYPYNAIMGRGSINKFEAAIHGLYLCMKISNPQGMITAYGNQQTTCNIEKDFVLGQRNVHCLTAKSKDGTKTVPLDPATPRQTVIISEDLTSQDKEKLISSPAIRTSSLGRPSTWSGSSAPSSSTA
jgi:hypothetical protein